MTSTKELLRSLTHARVGIGRAGGSLSTKEWLRFQKDQAEARTVVHEVLDAEDLKSKFKLMGFDAAIVSTRATTRIDFLQNPPHGKTLSETSKSQLEKLRGDGPQYDVAILVCDGLSSLAAKENAIPVFSNLIPLFSQHGLRMAPLVIATNARVALQDEVGEIFNAKLALSLIGERPGLGAADSLSAYFIFGPKVGSTDEQRNCISNIRKRGLTPGLAAQKIFELICSSLSLRLSGVMLKDEGLIVSSQQALGSKPE